MLNCGTHHGSKFWINLDPCGLFCGLMCWFLVYYGMYAASAYVIYPWLGYSLHGMLHYLLYNGMCILAVLCHLQAMTTDPGSVPKTAMPLVAGTPPKITQSDDPEAPPYSRTLVNGAASRQFCRRCNAFKPPRAHHCSMCGRCIVKMDHHCPWVNNCIGIGNHKYFLQFLFWILMVSIYALLLITGKYTSCSMSRRYAACGPPEENIWVVFLLVEAIMFGMFTCCMLQDQSITLDTNLTKIDRLKYAGGQDSSSLSPYADGHSNEFSDYNETFGCANEDVREHFYGFCDTEAMSSDNLSDLSRSSSNDNCSSASLSSGLDGSESGDIEAGVGEYDGEDSCEEGAACSSDHEEGEQPLLPLSSHNNNQISVPIDARPTSSNQMHNAAGLVRRAVN